MSPWITNEVVEIEQEGRIKERGTERKKWGLITHLLRRFFSTQSELEKMTAILMFRIYCSNEVRIIVLA